MLLLQNTKNFDNLLYSLLTNYPIIAFPIFYPKEYKEEERKVFISFMESCEICFQINKNKEGEKAVYISPQLLPDEPTAVFSLNMKRIWQV